MRYKQLVLRKLDELDNLLISFRSLLNSNPSIQQVDDQVERYKNKLEEIKTLINTEQEN